MLRVFHDRLVDDPDRVWIAEVIKSHLESHFRTSTQEVLGRLAAPAEPGEEESKYVCVCVYVRMCVFVCLRMRVLV